MNTNSIQKHYDKLTNKERFAALVAASARGDAQEVKALEDSTPSKTYKVYATQGLNEAFNFVGLWHVARQLGDAASFYFLMQANDKINDRIEGMIDEESNGESNLFSVCMDRLEAIATHCEAWRIVCAEYGVDPARMLEIFPNIEMVEVAELYARRFGEYVAKESGEPLELRDLQETIADYRGAIERKRKKWE